MNQSEREALVQDHMHLVPMVARHNRLFRSILKHSHGEIELDDMIQAGYIGLIDAAKKFDPQQKIKFNTYAEWRIRGEIMDFVRDYSPLARSVINTRTKINKFIDDVLTSTGRSPTEEEIRAHVSEVSDETFRVARTVTRIDSEVTGLEREERYSIFDMISTEIPNPEQALSALELQSRINHILMKLPTDWRLMTTLYFFERWSMKDIADLQGVTESRISQIFMKNIYPKLREYATEIGMSLDELPEDVHQNKDMTALVVV